MKKSLYVAVILLSVITSFAQDAKQEVVHAKNTFVGKHEFKIGILKPIIYEAVEVTYEYVASKKVGFGASVLFNIDKASSYQQDFAVTPFVRYYFQDPNKQNGNGLFLEGFAKFISGRYQGLNDVDIAYKSTSIGLGAGYKWLFKSGLIIEPVLGFSQAIAPKDSGAPGGGMRGDVSVGYRF